MRKANYEISPLILNRWSPRSMTGESLSDDELFPLFEAARWAPSSYNGQLWRFIIARRENKEDFERLFNLLAKGNQEWCKDAAVLVVVAAGQLFEYNKKPAVTHQFDAGAAWENLAIEANRRGLVSHGMEGFDYDRAKKDLAIPDDFDVLAMLAIGKPGPKEKLSEKLREIEQPNQRRPLKEIVFEGVFGKTIGRL